MTDITPGASWLYSHVAYLDASGKKTESSTSSRGKLEYFPRQTNQEKFKQSLFSDLPCSIRLFFVLISSKEKELLS